MTSAILLPVPKWENAPGVRTLPVVKAPIVGLMPRNATANDAPASRFADGSLGGVVVNLYWTNPNGSAGVQSAINGAVTLQNSSEWIYYRDTLTPANCGGTRPPCRIRLQLGDTALAAVKALNGGPLTIYKNANLDTATVALWWLTSALAAADNLISQMATAVTDTVDGTPYVGLESMPFVREIAVHHATTIFAEPCQRATGASGAGSGDFHSKNRQTFVTAGLTGCTKSGSSVTGPDPRDAAALLYPTTRWPGYGFTTTPMYWAWNPFQQWTSSGGIETGGVVDPAGYTASVAMGAAIDNMLSYLIVGNNSLRAPVLNGLAKYVTIYQKMVAASILGTLLRTSHQTATLDTIATTYLAANPAPADTSRGAALLAVCKVACGLIFAPGGDPNNLLTGLGSPFQFRDVSMELPGTWQGANLANGTQALSAATCAILNAAFAANVTV